MAADGPGGGWLDGRQGRAVTVTQLDVCAVMGFERWKTERAGLC